MHLSALGQSIIVLGSLKAANDLLDKRSAKYSSRPKFTMLPLCVSPLKKSPAPFDGTTLLGWDGATQ